MSAAAVGVSWDERKRDRTVLAEIDIVKMVGAVESDVLHPNTLLVRHTMIQTRRTRRINAKRLSSCTRCILDNI